MNKSLIIRFISIGAVSLVTVCGVLLPYTINADLNNVKAEPIPSTLVYNGHLTICKVDKTSYEVVKKIKIMVTGYSSTPDQTDDTPFITASGKHVADGIVANNMLPFGTKIRIPKLYGDKIFTVEDRMHPRFKNVDVWFPDRQSAQKFGATITDIEVLES